MGLPLQKESLKKVRSRVTFLACLCLLMPWAAGQDAAAGRSDETPKEQPASFSDARPEAKSVEDPDAVGREGAGQSSKPAAVLPGFHNTRFEENWSGLSENADRTGWGRFKYIPLTPGGECFVSLGGQLRGRTEVWNNFGFAGGEEREDAFGLLRLRLHGDFVLGPNVRVFVEGKSALSQGRALAGGNRLLDVDTADLQNAFVDLSASVGDGTKLTFRGGRQELQFGRQRLVSPLDWSNTRPRSFDGFRGILKGSGWQVDGFWTRHVRVRKYAFNPHDSGTDFFGVYATAKRPRGGVSLDAYWLGLERDSATFSGRTAPESRHTLGTRLAGASGALGYDVEAAYQVGRHRPADIRAYMVASELRYALGTRMAPVLGLGFDYASGDDDPLDDGLETFNQLFPLGHAYLGFADFVGRQNVIDVSQKLTTKPHSRLSLRADHHLFWRANGKDALYNAGGGVVRAGALGDSKRIGSEIDLVLNWQANRHTGCLLGYSHFFTSDFLSESGSDEEIDFVYVQIQYTF